MKEGGRTENDGIGGSQVDTQSTSSCTEAEHENFGTRNVSTDTATTTWVVMAMGGLRPRSSLALKARMGTHFVCHAVTISLR